MSTNITFKQTIHQFDLHEAELIYIEFLKKLLILITSKNIKTGVINDTLGQTHSPASSNHYFRLKYMVCFEKRLRTDDMCETIITTGCNCGLAKWINNYN